jgi:hypothetical protein
MNDDTKEMLYKVGGMGDPNGRYPQGEIMIRAPIKGEGQPMPYGDDLADDPAAVDTTYIEFSLPVAWEEECWAMLDAWFKAKAKENT